MKFLADSGARLDIADARGKTALDAALGTASGSGRTSTDAQPQTAALLRELMAKAAH